MMATNITEKLGLSFSIFLTVAGLTILGLGIYLPHWAVIISGLGISVLSGWASAITIKHIRLVSKLNDND